VVVLVYADWCGHCHTYKKGTWNNLKSMPNRKIPIAEVNETQLPNTPLKNAKIDGYPSVLVVGNNGKSAEFKDNATGQTTNALPISNNEDAMKTLLSEDPAKVAAENNLGTAEPAAAAAEESLEKPELVPEEPIEDNDTTTKPMSENARENMLNNAESLTLNSMSGVAAEGAATAGATGPAAVSPPEAEDDLLESQKASPSGMGNSSANSGQLMNDMNSLLNESARTGANSGPQLGGSLYASLLSAARMTAPAAILTGVAVARSRRHKSRRGRGRRGARRSTARRPA
jgi:hypothetical protein